MDDHNIQTSSLKPLVIYMYITILVKQVYWNISQVSGEGLQDHWSSGFNCFQLRRAAVSMVMVSPGIARLALCWEPQRLNLIHMSRFSGKDYLGKEVLSWICFNENLIKIMHHSFVTTAPPPTGKGGDCDFSVFNSLL